MEATSEYNEVISCLVEGMAVLVDSNSMQKKLLPDAIAWAEYTKNYKGIKYNHIGGAHQDLAGQWWISEEKRLMGGIGNTTIEEYLAKPYNLLFRAPKTALNGLAVERLDNIIMRESGNKRYRWGGLFTELIQSICFKLTGKNKEVDYKTKDGIYICSEWYGVMMDYATGLFPDWKGKNPADWQIDNRLYSVMLWSGQHQKLIILK